MLKLAKDFYITAYQKRKNFFQDNFLEQSYEYTFRYKEYTLDLNINFGLAGHTKEDNIAIINFGYNLDIEKWSNKKQRFQYIADVDSANGKSTKKYFDNIEAREIVLRFVEKCIDKYIKKYNPAIIVRGALSNIKINLPRYKRLDKKFFKYNYIKNVYSIDSSKSLYKICANNDDTDNKEIWVYCKKEWYFKQLDDVA